MSSAALDRLLAILLVAQLASGLLSLRAGVPATAPLFWFHGLVGGILLVAAIEKLRRSIGPALRRRRWGRLALGALLTFFVAAALAGGFAWVASGRILSIGPWTILTLHVFAGLAVVPIVIFHLLPKRWRLLRSSSGGGRPMTRRTMLGLGAVAALGAAAWGGANLLDRVQGGMRRFTGSRWLPDGGIPPPTTFYGEPTPPLDPETWELRITGRVARSLALDRAALTELGEEERSETLDCTGGWVMTTRWRGVPLVRVLEAAGAEPTIAFVRVRSVTGWMVMLEHREFETALLATGVAGVDLPTGNGAPCRLVAPRRRGLDWIKWVAEIEVG
jgi:DMSO/TMAO reductase YedYZ molybdopterin-dependent catalytic subunit